MASFIDGHINGNVDAVIDDVINNYYGGGSWQRFVPMMRIRLPIPSMHTQWCSRRQLNT